MPFCTVCGTELDENGICPKCAAEEQAPEQDGKIDKVVDRFQNAADETESYESEDISNNRIFAVLGYLGILLVVPIICAPESPFARFHASEAIDLLIFNVVYTIVAVVVTWLCFKVGQALGIIILGVFLILSIVSLLFWIMGISNAARGQAKEIPFIGKFKLLK